MNSHKSLQYHIRQITLNHGLSGLLIASLLAFNCDESLPPRDEPQNVLSARLSVTDGIFVFRERDDSSWTLTPMGMSIRVQNDYSEVLQDTLRIAGSLEIWNRLDPTSRAQYQLGNQSFTVSPTWVLTRGVLTLEPRGFVSLGMYWGHYIRQPVVRPIWCGGTLTPHINPSGEVYYATDRILVGVKAKIQVFREVALLSTKEVDAEVEYWIYPLPSSPPPDSTFCL